MIFFMIIRKEKLPDLISKIFIKDRYLLLIHQLLGRSSNANLGGQSRASVYDPLMEPNILQYLLNLY